MQKQPLISVIIPVYNAAGFLPRCLDSIIGQNYENLEIICINDGSTDNSAEILKEYITRDRRLKVITRSNKGAAASRNIGIKTATGAYLSFVDADDYLLPGLYEHFARTVKKEEVDIYMFNAQTASNASDKHPKFFNRQTFKPGTEEETVVDYRSIRNFFYGNQAVYNKIYRTAFLREKGLLMLEGNSFEDTHFYFLSLIKAQKIKFTYRSYYVYTADNDASVTKTFGENAFSVFAMFDSMEQEVRKAGLWEYFRYALFQLEYEKSVEILKMMRQDLKEDFFNHARQYVRQRLEMLDPAVYNRLRNIALGKGLAGCSYLDFKNTFLLAFADYRFQTEAPANPLFSVIVPVYNVRQYLPFCLKSLINQTFSNFEIVCVNDGSTDGVEEMLADFAAKDARIRVFHQRNKGLGGARNKGVREAGGEYLLFVDSDDWLAADALQQIAGTVGETPTDLGLFGFCEYEEATAAFMPADYIRLFDGLPVCGYRDVIEHLYRWPCAWSKFYRRSFFIRSNLFFPENVYFEDIIVNAKAFVCAKDIAFCRHNLYYYRLRGNSIMRSAYSHKKIDDIIYAFVSTSRWMKQKNVFDELKHVFALFVRSCLTMHLKPAGKTYGGILTERVNQTPEIKELLKISLERKNPGQNAPR